jgi:hypothetical protein
MYEQFEVRWEEVLPGTPEQAWDAITRRSAAWCWEIAYEPRVGGAERGLTRDGGRVTAWDEPRRFQTTAARADGWRNRLDYRLEPHADGTLVRFVQHGVLGADDYDRELDQCRQHTAFYRHSLGEYLRWFAGRDAACVGVEAPGSFNAVRRALGLAWDAAPGDRVRVEPAGLAPPAATVDYLAPAFLGLRTDDALIRVFGRDAWGGDVGVTLHLFDPAADPVAAELAWGTWLCVAAAPAREAVA